MPQPEHLDPTAYAADGSARFPSAPLTASEAALHRAGFQDTLAGTGGPAGILLIHGYTGSVAETRPMGEYLAAQGLAVRCPLLSGHGTTPHDLIRVRWQTWADQVELALQDLQRHCAVVFVGGLSLGSLLTLWLGAERPEIAGLIPMAPAIHFQNRLTPFTVVLRYLFKYNPFGPLGDDDLGDPEAIQRVWCYDELPLWGAAETYLLQRQAGRALPRIRQPILIFQGRRDSQLTPQAAQSVYDGVASTDKTLVWLENSGHNLLVDGEREAVWAQSYEWMMRVMRET